MSATHCHANCVMLIKAPSPNKQAMRIFIVKQSNMKTNVLLSFNLNRLHVCSLIIDTHSFVVVVYAKVKCMMEMITYYLLHMITMFSN